MEGEPEEEEEENKPENTEDDEEDKIIRVKLLNLPPFSDVTVQVKKIFCKEKKRKEKVVSFMYILMACRRLQPSSLH